jgi:hypothetical protein
MKAHEFDKKFETGKSVLDQLDVANARRPNAKTKRVNVDFPLWLVASLDKQAAHLGVTRQALIKLWIAEKCS